MEKHSQQLAVRVTEAKTELTEIENLTREQLGIVSGSTSEVTS